MEPYFLTEEDIKNSDIQGAMVGEQATPDDLALMGKSAALAPATEAPAGLTPTQQTYNAARAAGAEPENAPQSGGIPVAAAPVPSPTMGGGVLDILSTPIAQDPFENLSRNQRMMIGFAALKDAGMALQGKEGGAVRGVMNDITTRADMERKRQIQLAQVGQEQTRLQQEAQRQARIDALLMGVSAAGAPTPASRTAAGQAASPASIDDQISALRSQLGTYAQLDQMPVYEQRLAELTEMRDRQQEEQTAQAKDVKATTAQIRQAKSAVSAAEDALSAATGLSGDELKKQLESGAIDARSFGLTRQSFVPDTKAFKDYQAAAAKVASIMTFSNLGEIIEQGIKLGTMSDADFELIGNITGIVDPVNMPVQTADTIFEAWGKLTNTIKRLEEKQASGGPIDDLVKKYGG